MSDYTEGSRRRDRHRRHRGGGGQNREGQGGGRQENSRERGGQAREAQHGRDAPRGREAPQQKDSRRERREELPPLPKLPTPMCPRCNQPIQDITSALADKESGEAVHFDCVLNFLQGAESLGPNEKIVYIGHGRFAVMVFENPSDLKKFRIVRTIDWENRDTRAEWRTDISGRFSQIK